MIQKKPLIAILLYKSKDSTFHRIKMAINNGYKLYIFDNSPCNNSKLFIEENRNNIRYFTFDRNIGIGPALKLLAATAYYEGCRNLLYFDQDTIFSKKTLNYISEYINKSSSVLYRNQMDKILSVTFRDLSINRKKDQVQDKITIGKYVLNIVDFTISSGTLFYLENLKKVGWHDESYYIDGVDYSICLSAEAVGLKVAEINNTPELDHEVDQGNKNYKFLFKTVKGKKYPFYRIKGYFVASLKLLVKSILMRSKKTKKIFKMLLKYMVKQFLIYISKEK